MEGFSPSIFYFILNTPTPPMKKLLFSTILLSLFGLSHAQHSAAKPGEMVIIEGDYFGDPIDGYNLYLPKTYPSSFQSYPILIYLCGGSSVGGEIDVVKRWPIPKLLVEESDMSLERNQYALDSFIVVAPHMKAGPFRERQWYLNEGAIEMILSEIYEKYNADPYRVYITGLSRGGHGTWGLISKMGDQFAAAVPIAGETHGVEGYDKMLDLPIWTVHNTEDNMVGDGDTKKIVQKLEELTGEEFLKLDSPTGAGSDYLSHSRIFSSIPAEGHDAWTPMYESVEFYKWLLKHRIKN